MAPDKPDRLESWKAIANYLGRSERTARRWEAEEGLPVHRQMHRSLASVYAFRSEIDAWRQARDAMPQTSASTTASPSQPLPAVAIIVLPFAFAGPNTDEAYIADGFTDEVIAELSKLRSLRVISRTSSMALKGTQHDARALGEMLGVSHLLEGAVRHNPSGVRVNVNLIDACADRAVWSETYAGQVDDVFDIQEYIARETAAALELRLTQEDRRRLAERNVNSWPVWQAIIRARQESLRWNRAGIDNAVQMLMTGLSVSGDDAYLHAALARAHLQYREAGIDLGPLPLERAEHHIRKTFEIAPGCAAGYQASGWLHYSRGEIQLAVKALKAALDIEWADPDPLSVLCNCYLIAGQMTAARSNIERLLSIDPLTPLFGLLPAWADVLDGNPASAITTYKQMLEREPDSAMARLFLVWILAINGLTEELAEVADGFAAADRDLLPAQIAAQFAAAGGQVMPKVAITGRNQALAASNDIFPRMIAQAYALGGDVDGALEWLAVAVDRGFINFPYLDRHDPLLSRLKTSGRYARLLQDVKRRWEAFEA